MRPQRRGPRLVLSRTQPFGIGIANARDPNGRAYNRTAFLKERRQMMQTWADYLDGLKAGAKIIPLKRSASSTSK